MNINSETEWIKKKNDFSIFLFGFAFWKLVQIRFFFSKCNKNKIHRCNNLEKALKIGIKDESIFFIWGQKYFNEVEEYAKKNKIKLYRVEDGFIRSIAPNSGFPTIFSIVIDSRGLYFNPSQESDLEYIYNTYEFDEEIQEQARQIIKKLSQYQLTKYNHQKANNLFIRNKECNKIILVVGQIETGWSATFGGFGISIIDMVKLVRKRNQNAHIIFKVPPDLTYQKNELLKSIKSLTGLVDQFAQNSSIIDCINASDEIHTLTSLAGFEALVRNKKVYTYGLPFYAGWGLTEDIQICERRSKKLTIEELVAGAMILYPLYINPRNKTFCEPISFIDELSKLKIKYDRSWRQRVYLKLKMFLLSKPKYIRR